MISGPLTNEVGMSRRQLVLTVILALVALLVVGIVIVAGNGKRRERQMADAELSEELQSDLLGAIELYVDRRQTVPRDFQALYSDGQYLFTPAQFNQMIELGHNDTPGGMPVLNYMNEQLAEAKRQYQEREIILRVGQ